VHRIARIFGDRRATLRKRELAHKFRRNQLVRISDRPANAIEDFLDVERAHMRPEDHQANNKASVADAIGDERLVSGRRSTVPFVVETNQEVRADADQFPTDKDLEKVVGHHQVEHREAEQRQEHEETPKSAAAAQMAMLAVNLMVLDDQLELVSHVAHRVQMDEHGHERDHYEHDSREHVDAVADPQQRAVARLVARAVAGIGGDAWQDTRPWQIGGPLLLEEVLLQLDFFMKLNSVFFDLLLRLIVARCIELGALGLQLAIEVCQVRLMVVLVRPEKNEAKNAAGTRKANGRGGNKSRPAAAHVAAQRVEHHGCRPPVLRIGAQRPAHRSPKQQQRKGRQRQQGGRDEEQTGRERQLHRGYPFSSSAVSTSTVVWLL
jgi:hypothetical protein